MLSHKLHASRKVVEIKQIELARSPKGRKIVDICHVTYGEGSSKYPTEDKMKEIALMKMKVQTRTTKPKARAVYRVLLMNCKLT